MIEYNATDSAIEAISEHHKIPHITNGEILALELIVKRLCKKRANKKYIYAIVDKILSKNIED